VQALEKVVMAQRSNLTAANANLARLQAIQAPPGQGAFRRRDHGAQCGCRGAGEHRWWGSQEYVPGNYYNKTPGTLFYTPDLSRQAFIDPHQRDNTFRLTWQASQKHKVTFLQTIQDNCLCFYAVGQNVSPEASGNAHQIPMRLTQIAWTYPVTS
jgi:hypothetical protein